MSRRLKSAMVVLVLAAFWAWGCHALVQRANREARMAQTQETLRSALIAYFEDQESYPPLNRASAGDLAQFLTYSGHLDGLPVNPATGHPYGTNEDEPHTLWYVAEEDFSGWSWEMTP